jgi:hypothetical protein
MRQLLVLLLSFGALILFAGTFTLAETPAGTSENKGIELAQQELARVKNLVDAGALARVRIQEAEANLDDAKDEVVLAHDLYGDLPEKGASEAASEEMIAAAQRRVDRQQTRLEEAQKIVAAGVAARSYLAPFQAELSVRQTGLDLAHLRAHLMADRAAMNRLSDQSEAPPVVESFPQDDSELTWQGMEHYEGDGAFSEARELQPLRLAFASQFDRPLPISAEGETGVHRALGFDHRGRVDVAVVPGTPEGVWLRHYLQLRKIPYYAFSRAIPGKATAAHIHIGPGSTRLASQVITPLSKRAGTHPHVAD